MTTWTVAVAVAAALSACGGTKPQVRPPAVLVVIEPGAEPRQLLRYSAPAPRVPERIEVRIKIRGSTAFTNTVLETGQTDADAPTVRLIARLESTGTTPSGDTLISYELEQANVLGDFVDPRMVRQLESEVIALKGMRGTWQRSPSGLVANVVFDAAAMKRANHAGLAGVADAILQNTVRFPDVPVGSGAMWRTEYDDSHAGMRWRTTTTCRVKELSATHVSVETSLAMRAPSQPLSVEPNASVRLTSGERSVSQLLVVALDRLAATGETKERAELNLLVVRGKLRVTSTVQLESVGFFRTAVSPDGQ